jgi:3-hydroxypropanoate dehydrogenase
MGTSLDDAALDAMFRTARTQNRWLDQPVSDEQLQALYDLMRWGPTSANSFPVRIVFVTSPAAKERLKPLVLAGNQQKVITAPVTAILGYDTRFYEWLPRLFPHGDARSWFLDKPEFAEATAFRNSSLQGAYFIIAARALGLDCGPMSGFDNEAVDREFFPGRRVKSNFLCALGHGDPAGLFERLPRPAFSEVCSIV